MFPHNFVIPSAGSGQALSAVTASRSEAVTQVEGMTEVGAI